MTRISEDQLQEVLGKPWRNQDAPKLSKCKQEKHIATQPRHKFNARQVEYDGIKFDSKLEGDFYLHLKLQQQAKQVLFFLRQVPIHLLGGTKLVVDFQVFYADGTCRFIDTKGVETSDFLIKKREVEHHYPFEIEVIKRGDF
ncbi:MAG: DUF1064 domain-containing protein [Thiothrix sp.]|nr:MAG: DUF1064 domain-containing protein [Thiothrix sp.]